MATSNLLQKLDGETEFGGSTSNRRTIETFLAGAALAAGDWVQFDTSQAGADRVLYVIEAPLVATHGNSKAFGCSLDAATAVGDSVRIVTAGYLPQAGVAGAVVAGDLLVGPIGTAGEAAIFVPGTTEGRIIGEALAVDSPTGFGPVCVFRAY